MASSDLRLTDNAAATTGSHFIIVLVLPWILAVLLMLLPFLVGWCVIPCLMALTPVTACSLISWPLRHPVIWLGWEEGSSGNGDGGGAFPQRNGPAAIFYGASPCISPLMLSSGCLVIELHKHIDLTLHCSASRLLPLFFRYLSMSLLHSWLIFLSVILYFGNTSPLPYLRLPFTCHLQWIICPQQSSQRNNNRRPHLPGTPFCLRQSSTSLYTIPLKNLIYYYLYHE